MGVSSRNSVGIRVGLSLSIRFRIRIRIRLLARICKYEGYDQDWY